ncbi:hypothetical protein WA026_009754 [Henosepilachna vigintioctopunctata]|uniref:Uncharacterized protein n=1 Tax=Henosepilachna vigintioctopunctata TaxID=420089 RepID=A0AAW1TUG7_9CUCU
MSAKDLVQQYKEDVNNLVESAKEHNLPNQKIEEIFDNCFNTLRGINEYEDKVSPKVSEESEFQTSTKNINQLYAFSIRIIKIFLLIFTLAIFIYILLNVHQPTASLVLRNVQGLIYPGLKILRFLSVPIIKRYPSLTELYDESCLLENPYFYVHDMECWPCQNVYSVFELKGPVNQSMYLSGIPYVTKTSHQVVPYTELRNLYELNEDILNKESSTIKSTTYKIENLKELFSQNPDELSSSNIHFSWRINKMSPARIIRKLFPRPEIFPERTGQSVERYIIVDGTKASPYSLPNTECGFISVRQAYGQRTIFLKPSQECSGECRTLSVVLQPSTILLYNWWYWRPISLPTENSSDISILYISSYC